MVKVSPNYYKTALKLSTDHLFCNSSFCVHETVLVYTNVPANNQGSKFTENHRPGARPFSVEPVNSRPDKSGVLAFLANNILNFTCSNLEMESINISHFSSV